MAIGIIWKIGILRRLFFVRVLLCLRCMLMCWKIMLIGFWVIPPFFCWLSNRFRRGRERLSLRGGGQLKRKLLGNNQRKKKKKRKKKERKMRFNMGFRDDILNILHGLKDIFHTNRLVLYNFKVQMSHT